MGITPYTPTAFTTPAVNPAVGGAGVVYPYASNTVFRYTPTAMDTTHLVARQDELGQANVLANVLAQASGWADRICFGQDASGKGASLCATVSVETDYVTPINGTLRLLCDYKPIIEVLGIDIGYSMNALASIGDSTASQLRIGRRTITVPLIPYVSRGSSVAYPPVSAMLGQYVAVWSYVNGYVHTKLAAAATAGASTLEVAATDGNGGLLGVIPGFTRLVIQDEPATQETVLVQSVSGTTITTASPLQFAHPLPAAPDFTPVTALPAEVSRAVVFLAEALIKTQGDNSLILQAVSEPKKMEATQGEPMYDVHMAMAMLQPFMMRYKSGRH